MAVAITSGAKYSSTVLNSNKTDITNNLGKRLPPTTTSPAEKVKEDANTEKEKPNRDQLPPDGSTSKTFTPGPDGTYTYTQVDNATPFNNVSKDWGGTNKWPGMRTKFSDVKGPYLTTKNPFYINQYSNKIGYVMGHGNWGGGYILPNCINLPVGRFLEVLNITSKDIDPWPYADPRYWETATGYPIGKISGYTKDLQTPVYTDENGRFGPKGGKWLKAVSTSGLVPVPGTVIYWRKIGHEGHVGFIEAIRNAGTPDEYVYVSESAYAMHGNAGGQIRIFSKKYTKYGFPYAYHAGNGRTTGDTSPARVEWNGVYFFYNPASTGSGGSGFVQITLDYKKPKKEQIDNYNKVIKQINQATNPLPVGTKVKIQSIGSTDANGKGLINKINGIGYVSHIEAAGTPYPYRVSTSTKGGDTIGYFQRSALTQA